MAMARMKERLEELEQLDQREWQAVIAEFDDDVDRMAAAIAGYRYPLAHNRLLVRHLQANRKGA